MNEDKLREVLREPIVSIPPVKVRELFGDAWRNTLILHEGEIDVIVARLRKAEGPR